MRDSRSKSSEIAPGVYLAVAGPRTNAYFVRSGASWVLIDTGWRGRAAAIKTQAEAVFGRDARPAAILLTHIHPDHSGSALPLAEIWEVPVYVHPDELAMAGPDYPMEFANPVDRRISAVLGRLIPRRTRERTKRRVGPARRHSGPRFACGGSRFAGLGVRTDARPHSGPRRFPSP